MPIEEAANHKQCDLASAVVLQINRCNDYVELLDSVQASNKNVCRRITRRMLRLSRRVNGYLTLAPLWTILSYIRIPKQRIFLFIMNFYFLIIFICVIFWKLVLTNK